MLQRSVNRSSDFLAGVVAALFVCFFVFFCGVFFFSAARLACLVERRWGGEGADGGPGLQAATVVKELNKHEIRYTGGIKCCLLEDFILHFFVVCVSLG